MVNTIDTKSSTKNDNFANLEINDLLENMKELLNYIKKNKKRKGEPEPNTNIRRRDAERARWAGQALLINYAQKSSLQKIFGSNLTLTAREARGIALTPWSFVTDARQKISETDPVSTVVRLYILARTYFKANC